MFEFQNEFSWSDIIAVFSALVSLGALIAAIIIGITQNRINKRLLEIQDYTDVYIDISERKALFNGEEKIYSIIRIHNISTMPLTLTGYNLNGMDRKVAPYRLPPSSQFNQAHYYIYLDIFNYVSFQIFFSDAIGTKWKATGYCEFRDGKWDISHESFEKVDESKK